MKAELTIPMEQYGNIRPQVEGTPEEIVAAYREFKQLIGGGPGLAAKEWNHCVDTYMQTGTLNGGTEFYALMSPQQQWFFQEVKKHNKRANYKSNEE